MYSKSKVAVKYVIITMIVFSFMAISPQTSWGIDPSKYPKQLVIRAGTVGGPWVPMGTMFADVMMKKFPGLNVMVQPGGAVSNVKIIDKGEDAVLGFTYSPLYWEGRLGQLDKGKKYNNLSALFACTASFQQMAVRANSDIRSFEDLKNKHISTGHRGGGDEIGGRRVLETYGITYDSIRKAGGKVSFLQSTEMGMALKDNILDFGNFAGNAPHATLQDVETSTPIRLLNIDKEHAAKLIEKYPFYAVETLPAGTFKGMKEPATQVINVVLMIANNSLSDEFLYELTKLMVEKGPEMRKSLPFIDRLNPPSKAVFSLTPKMMHPSAVKYFKEIGVFK